MNSTSLWQRFGAVATRNYAAAAYYNANGDLPPSWDWLASKHLVKLPDPLNLEDCRLLEVLNWEWKFWGNANGSFGYALAAWLTFR